MEALSPPATYEEPFFRSKQLRVAYKLLNEFSCPKSELSIRETAFIN